MNQHTNPKDNNFHKPNPKNYSLMRVEKPAILAWIFLMISYTYYKLQTI